MTQAENMDLSPYFPPCERLPLGDHPRLVVDFLEEADLNGDGAIDGLDVAPFVQAILSGGYAAAVPEPPTWVLAAIGALWLRRKALGDA